MKAANLPGQDNALVRLKVGDWLAVGLDMGWSIDHSSETSAPVATPVSDDGVTAYYVAAGIGMAPILAHNTAGHVVSLNIQVAS
jgi:hypothetical protein